MKLRLGLIGVFLSAACDPPTIPPKLASEVYEFRLPANPPAVLRWPSGAVVRVYVAGGAQAARAQLLASAFDNGARVWNDRALYHEYELVRVADVGAADVVLRWSDETPPVITSGCVPDITGSAVTTFCLDHSDPQQARLHVFPLVAGDELSSRVRMIITVLGTEAARAERLGRVVTHELGHVLGLSRHSLNEQDLMYGGEVQRSTLSPRDAATLQVLYQTRPAVLP